MKTKGLAHKWIANLFVLLAIFSFCFLSVSLANAGLGEPSLQVSAYVTPSEIERGSSGELIVRVSEVGGVDWAKDVTVTPSITDGCTISPSSKSTPRIGESSSTTFHFTIYASKDASLGKKAGDISVRYYDTGWMDVGTFGPHYTTGSFSFTVKKGYGSIRVSSNPSGADVYVDGIHRGKTPLFISKIIEGAHSVKLTKLGYEDVSETIYVSVGETTYVSETLPFATWLLASILGIIALIIIIIGIFVTIRRKQAKSTVTKAEEITEKEKEIKIPEPEEVRERLRETYPEKDAARLANAFRIVQDIRSLYCTTDTTAREINKEFDLLKMYLSEKEFLGEIESIQRKINAELREDERLGEKHVEEVKDFCDKFTEMWIAKFLK